MLVWSFGFNVCKHAVVFDKQRFGGLWFDYVLMNAKSFKWLYCLEFNRIWFYTLVGVHVRALKRDNYLGNILYQISLRPSPEDETNQSFVFTLFSWKSHQDFLSTNFTCTVNCFWFIDLVVFSFRVLWMLFACLHFILLPLHCLYCMLDLQNQILCMFLFLPLRICLVDFWFYPFRTLPSKSWAQTQLDLLLLGLFLFLLCLLWHPFNPIYKANVYLIFFVVFILSWFVFHVCVRSPILTLWRAFMYINDDHDDD